MKQDVVKNSFAISPSGDQSLKMLLNFLPSISVFIIFQEHDARVCDETKCELNCI